MSEKTNLPTVQQLFEESDNLPVAFANEKLNFLLNQEPKKEWIKVHPFIKNHKYIPIGIVEYLLKKIFKKYKIEILREGVAFNGVYVVVRVYYLNPTTNEMDYHDGIGACQLQTKKDTSPADLININNGAVSMAFPIAETYAIKDACDKFGTLFGANLNREHYLTYSIDDKLKPIDKELDRKRNLLADCKTIDEVCAYQENYPDWDISLFNERKEAINGGK